MPIRSETLYKVMIPEVAQLSRRDRAGLIAYLGKHPEIITRLVEYPLALDRLSTVPMALLPIDEPLLRDASGLAIRHGLLTNDALILASMHRHELIHLVTNGDDFDRVPDVKVWKPR